MKRLTLYALTPAIFILMFYGACSESKTTPPPCDGQVLADSLNSECWARMDSSKRVVEDAHRLLTTAYDSIKGWKQIVTINHLTIERLDASVRDLSFDLNAEREHFQDMKAKYENRLDSAVAIIRRQQDQLKRCVIDGRIK
jgi:hypothetical protein